MTTTEQTTGQALMAAKEPSPIIPTKGTGWENRQQDTGWGRAVAHIVPIYPLIYAITRRTITPALYVLGGTFAIGVGVALANPNMTEKQIDSMATTYGVLATPFLAKAGIRQARKYAELRLS